ncbi:MAG: Rrf2 family transcriptional regulator [Candidatus Bipolaricaulota bacterium]|nr:Rrf2 family transcriptional regulator [Candidatus Bipolaricaulota bacterium]
MITSKRFGYGLCVLYELATREGGHHSARDLAQGYSVPEAFVRRILLDLRRAGFVQAQKGRMGGYQLAHPPQEIKLGDLMKALEPEEPVLIYGRQRRGTSMQTDVCPVAPFWQGVEARFAAQLGETTLADVIAQVGAPTKPPAPKGKATRRRRKRK